jgi:hypothetical protein
VTSLKACRLTMRMCDHRGSGHTHCRLTSSSLSAHYSHSGSPLTLQEADIAPLRYTTWVDDVCGN